MTESNKTARGLGLFFLLIGMVMTYLNIYLPISGALRGESYISYSEMAVCVAPVSILLGLYLIVVGDKAFSFHLSPQMKIVLIILAAVIVLIVAFGSLLAMRYFLMRIGYF